MQIVDVNNGSRFETYTISGERGSGMICLNGAAARCVSTGDKVIIMCYAQLSAEEAKRTSRRSFCRRGNRIERITTYEKHGLLRDMVRQPRTIKAAVLCGNFCPDFVAVSR